MDLLQRIYANGNVVPNTYGTPTFSITNGDKYESCSNIAVFLMLY